MDHFKPSLPKYKRRHCIYQFELNTIHNNYDLKITNKFISRAHTANLLRIKLDSL